MKKNNTITIIFYLASVIWFLLAFFKFFISKDSSQGTVYLSLGSLWLCLGAAFAAKMKKEEKTISYYNENAKAFVERTYYSDMSGSRNRFKAYVKEAGLILDWGCGSGRDSKAFIEDEYSVEAVDASTEMCRIASENAGIEVRNERFEDLDAKEMYDGIWASASLLHVESEYLSEIIEKAMLALKPGGAFYMSFKYGDFEGEQDGRFFTYMNEERFTKAIKGIKNFKIAEQWVSDDVREEYDFKWFNIIMIKEG